MAENSERVVEIFSKAIELPTGERTAFLDRACAGDDELRRKLENWLKCNDQVGTFLEEPVGTMGEEGTKAPPGEKPGDRIDRYLLFQQIGEGGCGIVFQAEQREPVRRTVAVKVIKPGMDSKSVIARFEAERQALALMDHQNIAHVFDASTTESGRPYFVMELVKGEKITEYCDQKLLSIAARLELFVQVCEAIQHAHQKGIIHRDIKPSNILVTTGADGRASPKVIDFGIAKATVGLPLTNKTIFTACEMLIGTPAYMSPEQAALASTEVDTRTDIYSLGVLLYELLTGTTPFDTHQLLKAGFDEVRRVIRDQEPMRPSTRLNTMVSAELGIVSQRHGAEAPQLIREMRGDLDWIVMKALEKDRKRRYQTADALAEDIERYLRDETVFARPPSRLYQFQKLVSRHKLEFTFLSIVMVTLVAGLSITSRSLAREKAAHREADLARAEATQQRKLAEVGEEGALTEAARSRQATEFLKSMLSGIDPMVARGRDTTLLREILDQTVSRMDVKLTNQPAIQADFKLTIGGVYGTLGHPEEGEPLVRDAVAYFRTARPGAEHKLADALSTLSVLHMSPVLNKLEEAEQESREALSIETHLQGAADLRLATIETRLAWAIFRLNRYAEAEAMFRQALATGERLVGDDSEMLLKNLLETRGGLATALNMEGKYAEAEQLVRQSLLMGEKGLGPEHPYVANDMFRLAFILGNEGELAEAESFSRQCLAIRRKIVSPDHPLYDDSLFSLARVLRMEGKKKESADCLSELLAIRRKRFGDTDHRVTAVAGELSGLLVDIHDEVRFQKLAGDFPGVWFARGEMLAKRGQWTEAAGAALTYVKIEPGESEGYHEAIPLLVQTGDRKEYEALCEQITSRFAVATNANMADRMAKDCLILPRPGADLNVAAELAETAVAHASDDPQSIPNFRFCKALAQYRLGHFAEAANWAHLAVDGANLQTQAEAAAVMAMSRFKLGQFEKADAALADCNQIIEVKMPKLTEDQLATDWRDGIMARALQSEAKHMIDGQSSAAALPANPPR